MPASGYGCGVAVGHHDQAVGAGIGVMGASGRPTYCIHQSIPLGAGVAQTGARLLLVGVGVLVLQTGHAVLVGDGPGVGVFDGVTVAQRVLVGVLDGVGVMVGVGEIDGVGVAVGVLDGVYVMVGVLDGVRVGVMVGVLDGVRVDVLVGVFVRVGVLDAVGVLDGV